MVQIPSSHLEPFAKEPAFVEARLTLERCIREFQRRHCSNNQPQPPSPVNIQVPATMSQCFCACSSSGCCGCCGCKCGERFQSVTSTEWLPTQFVVNLIRQMFQQPWEIRWWPGSPDQSNLMAQLFVQQMQAHVMSQQGNNQLVQAVPGPGQINLTPNYFQLVLDVSGIRPDELSVAVNGRCVLVGAQRKGRVTGVQHQEALLRRYELPMTADSEQAQCRLTPEGLLHIAAPWRAA